MEGLDSTDELNLGEGWQEIGAGIPDFLEASAVDLTGLMELDFFEDEDFHCSDGAASDTDGFDDPQPKYKEIICTVMQVLEEAGFRGSKLALQSGSESELLTQALEEANLKVSVEARGYILKAIYSEVEKATLMEPMLKRGRGDSSRPALARLWDSLEMASSTHLKEREDAPSPLPLPPRGTKGRRKGFQIQDPEASEQRKLEEEEKMNKLRGQLADILVDADTPNSRLAETTENPRRVLLGLMGKTRLNTASKYLRIWTEFSLWLSMTKGTSWPREEGHLLDYLFVLRDEPCRPSVPGAWHQAVRWMFRKAGFIGDLNLAESLILKANLERLGQELFQFQRPILQAARFPIGILAALEVYLMDQTKVPLKRIFAGGMLTRAWGTLRFDDIQRIRRNTVRMVGDNLVTELLSTKTTGPGKRVRQLPVAISNKAYLIKPGWIEEWLSLLQEYMPKDRDYLLDVPSKDFKEAKDARLKHSQSSAITKMIMTELRVPRCKEGRWEGTDESLVPELLTDLFGEHSGRAVLPSMSIHIEDDKSKRDCLGRWKPSASDDYTRTYRVVVTSIQARVAQAVKAGNKEVLKEHDIIDRASRHLRERKKQTEEEVKRVCKDWETKLENVSKLIGLNQEYLNDLHELEETALVNLLATADTVRVRAAREVPGGSREKVTRSSKYLITYSENGRIARLHSTSRGCYWAGVEVRHCKAIDEVTSDMYNRRCKFCWPALITEPKIQEGSETGESDSSSEESE